MGQFCAQSWANRAGRREAKPQSQPKHSLSTALLSLQARVGSSPGDKATPHIQGRTPWQCPSLLPHSSCVPDVPGFRETLVPWGAP